MNLDRMRGIIEAIIFAAERPVSLDVLAEVFEDVSKKELETLLETMVSDWRAMNRGFQLNAVAGGWQFRTRAEMAPWLQRLRQERPSKLSRAALEAMSIIAYKQPMTRPEVDDLRGVDSAGVIKNLLERGLIKIVGKKDAPGKPVVYGTTDRFLEVFSLRDLGSLPSLRDLKELEEGDGDQLDLPTGPDGLPTAEGEGAESGDPAEPEVIDDSERRRKIRDDIRGKLADAVVRPDQPLEAADASGLPVHDEAEEEDVLSELEAALRRRKEVVERTDTLLDESEKDYIEKVTAEEEELAEPIVTAAEAGVPATGDTNESAPLGEDDGAGDAPGAPVADPADEVETPASEPMRETESTGAGGGATEQSTATDEQDDDFTVESERDPGEEEPI